MSNPPASNHRALTGFVTKLVGDGATYGFINDEIFFPQTTVTGGPAAVGDQVFAECEFSAHLPIKWNATSVKIVNKGSVNQHQQGNNNVIDPRQQHQQDSMIQQHQQQQQQFNQAAPVAVTYQQHRQQRQQRQMLDVKQPDTNIKPQNPQQNQSDHPGRLLDQANNQGGEFYPGSFAQQNQQQQDSSIQPFQEQPMGPPNFTYTSQLGSAFVQSPFVPAPFLAQQPPPMLPQQQQQQQQQQPQPQQHLLPNNQQMHNQNSQRHNNHPNKGAGNRFNNNNNNQSDKNDRQNNRRNMNRNDDKYDRQRSGDREGSLNRSGRSRNSRERSIGRGSKRDDPPTRPSPPSHSSNRSTTSVSSDRGAKSRRHYEVQNIPKSQIMTNMNAYNMKQRCPSSVHVPSDLKDIIVNKYFRLDIKNTPKPIKYIIEQPKKDDASNDQVDKELKETKVKDEATTEETSIVEKSAESESTVKKETSPQEEIKREVKVESRSLEQPTPPSSRSDTKLPHKYGVKVILLSLPELETIYKSVFGENLDSYCSDSKSHKRLDEVISLLCNKGSNNGFSLIGGKFDPVIDGFLEGETNGLNERQPDLIATCKRVILEQTCLDLGRCKSWSLLSTFMYNHKSDYFSQKASVEYSFIYMPQTWTMLSDSFDKVIIDREVINSREQEQEEAAAQVSDDPLKVDKMEVIESDTKAEPDTQTENKAPHEHANADVDAEQPVSTEQPLQNEHNSALTYESLVELKVTDLKAELDKRNVKYKTGSKKAELVALLQESLKPDQDQKPGESQDTPADSTGVEESEKVDSKEENQPEEGEVLEAEASDDSLIPETDSAVPPEESSGKRKNVDDAEDGSTVKKMCTDEKPAKEERIELIRESFVVRARDEQQQLSLVSLYEAGQAARHDQFELSVASLILKESLVQHLSEYILTTLVEDNRQRATPSAQSASTSSQETGSDTNNNSTTKTFKNPSTSDQKVNLKELPVDRYINLAFSYFDSSHMGFVYFDDLNKLFNNTSLTISKRALISLTGDGEKFNYRTLPDLSPKLPPTYVYEFPDQFRNLNSDSPSSATAEKLAGSGRMIEYKGVTYDVESLVQQVKDAETLRVNLVDRFNYAIENSDKQAEEIHVLEVNQKSLAKAIKTQNDEICDLKRERDSIKKKYESVRKGIKGTISSLSDLVKEDK